MLEHRIGAWQASAIELLRSVGGASAEVRPLDDAGVAKLHALQIDGLYRRVHTPDAPELALYDATWATQAAEARRAVRALVDVGVPTVVFKGIECVARYFDGHALSIAADIDVLVDRADLGLARAALYTAGYRQAKFDRAARRLVDADVLDVAEVEGKHYELFPFSMVVPVDLGPRARALAATLARPPLWVDGDRAYVVVEIDVHHRVALDIDSADLMAARRPGGLGVGDALTATDHLWFLTARLYNEVAIHGKRSLRDFAYIVAIIARDQVDWDALVVAAEHHALNPGLFYYLSFAQAVCGAPVPAGVLERLRPERYPRLRDWGWQLATIFELADPSPFDRAIR